MNDNPIKKILLLAAHPLDMTRLKLEREVEEIRTTLNLAVNRARFTIEHRGSVRSSEIQQHMYDVKPWIVHFAGHGVGAGGSSTEGLVFEDDRGRSQLVSGTALANLFNLFSTEIACVVLNACYSEQQAREIVRYIPYVVGMKWEIGDLAARKFSQGFYRAIWDDRSIEEAFLSGKNAIELDGIPEELTPILLQRSTEANESIVLENYEPQILNTTMSNSDMSEEERQRLEQEKAGWEESANLLIEKLNELRGNYAIEAGTAIKFQLKQQIKKTESELASANTKIKEIEQKLNQISNNIARPIESIGKVNINSLEIPGKAIALDSLFYIDRPPLEEEYYQAIVNPGALLRIKAPRKMGKSSLLLRIVNHPNQSEYKVVSLDLQLADRESFANLDTFLQWFCDAISDGLNIENQVSEYWQGRSGCKIKCTNYFQRYLLPKFSVPIILCVDGLDEIFQYREITIGFSTMLRSWHDNNIQPIWKNLRLVLVYCHEEDIPMDINNSVFTVGTSIELPYLNKDCIDDLIQRHGLNLMLEDRENLMKLTAGHPYLIQVALYYLARQTMTVAEFIRNAPNAVGYYGEHLRLHVARLHLQRHSELLTAIKQIISVDVPVRIDRGQAYKLVSMGLVKYVDNNKVLPTCDLYRRYLREVMDIER
jgi:AAA-like domain/CHAT domain